eukprot:scaffold85309_cov63-Phaeocystis_antarctica.AAC.2
MAFDRERVLSPRSRVRELVVALASTHYAVRSVACRRSARDPARPALLTAVRNRRSGLALHPDKISIYLFSLHLGKVPPQSCPAFSPRSPSNTRSC